jgi:hypothetical protein
MDSAIQNEIAALNRIDAIKLILKNLCRTTGMRISVVARVTADSWTACAVHDETDLNLKPGDELEISTTL